MVNFVQDQSASPAYLGGMKATSRREGDKRRLRKGAFFKSLDELTLTSLEKILKLYRVTID